MANTIQLAGSNSTIPNDAISVVPVDLSTVIKSTIYVRRNDYNGMTVAQYADTVIAGINPPLNREQFKAMFGASAQDLADVAAWISGYGITVTGTYRSSAAVELTGTVEQFNTAFGIELQTVTIPDYSYMSYNGSLNILDTLDGIIEHVSNLEQQIAIASSMMPPPPPPMAAASPVPKPGSVSFVTPQAVADVYNFPGQNNGNDGTGQVIAIIQPFGAASGFGGYGGGYSAENLSSTFTTVYGVSTPTIIPVTLNGTTNNPTGPTSVECMLDIAMVGGIVPKATIIVYFCTNYTDSLTAILNDTAGTGYYPKIISISAGGVEAPAGEGGTFFSQVDTLLAQCAAQGITVCIASGDWGPNNSPVGYYTPPTPSNTACWPASSPYVLAVGGTTLFANPDGTWANEVAWNNEADYYVTGGQISQRYAVPTWQNGLSYNTNPGNVTVTLTSGSLSTTQGRTLPDVALNADPYCGYSYYYTDANGFNMLNSYGGGASAAAPLWAGLVARQNQISGSNVGFVNATYYANPGNFHDIVSGNNHNYDTPSISAFNATVGYDATTGLGSFMGEEPTPPTTVPIYIGAGVSIGSGITFD